MTIWQLLIGYMTDTGFFSSVTAFTLILKHCDMILKEYIVLVQKKKTNQIHVCIFY